MIKEKTKLLVSAIKNGTVIDHIEKGNALQIVKLLNLPSEKKVVTVGLNLPSKEMGYKDLIKVEEKELTQAEVNEVAILAPNASINIIKNYEVFKKFNVEIPKIIEYVIVCPNSKCITNNERMETKFHVTKNDKGVHLKCNYCEKKYTKNQIKKYNT